MSASRIKYITQEFGISSSNWANNVYTANTVTNHSLFANVEVTLLGSIGTYSAPATVVANNQFSVPMIKERTDNYQSYAVKGYLPGTVGGQEAQSMQRGMATDAIIQSYVTGTGTAQYNIEVSLDSQHWINAATVIHANTTNDTGFCKVAPGWCFYRANVASVGANTLLSIISGN